MFDEEETVYVVDTSVLINDPKVFFKLGSSRIVIPAAAIKELDQLKRSSNLHKALPAREVARTLDRLGSRQDIAAGAKTSAGSTVSIFHRYMIIDDLASPIDNRIVGTALRVQHETGNDDIILISCDGNMRNIARAYGIQAENYPLRLDNSKNSRGKPASVTKSSIDHKAA